MQTTAPFSMSQDLSLQPSQKANLLKYRGVSYQRFTPATQAIPRPQPLLYRGIPYQIHSTQFAGTQSSYRCLRYRGIAYQVTT